MWAFITMLKNMRAEGMTGVESTEKRLKTILENLADSLPVIIVKMKPSDELWEEFRRSQDIGHTDLVHSVDRTSVRFKFFRN